MVENIAKLGVKAHRIEFRIIIKMLEPNHVKTLNFKQSDYNGTFFIANVMGLIIDFWL